MTVSLDASANLLSASALEALRDLAAFCEPRIVPDCASVSLVGRGIRSILHRLGGVFELFEEQRVHLVSQAASDLNLTVVVDSSQAGRLVSQLRAAPPGHRGATRAVLGRSATEAAEGAPAVDEPWWARRQPAAGLRRRGHPVYVYDRRR